MLEKQYGAPITDFLPKQNRIRIKYAGPVGIPDDGNEINIFRSHDLRLSSPATSSLYKGVSGSSEDRRDVLTTLRAQQTF
jgi:hypothetical protein